MVAKDVSTALLTAEFEEAQPFAEAQGWDLDRTGDLTVLACMVAPMFEGSREQYVFRLSFDDYPEKPPLIDVIHPDTKAENEAKCFPTGHGYFHGKQRICAGWSRRAYKIAYADGPHDDWAFSTWKTHAEGVTRLGLILQELWKALNDPAYRGRDKA